MIVHHRLQQNAVRGPEALCQPQDYPAFRALYREVRRGAARCCTASCRHLTAESPMDVQGGIMSP